MQELERVLMRAEGLLERLEGVLPPRREPTDWEASIAFRWRGGAGRGYIEPVRHPHLVRLEDLRGIDRQKAVLLRNTRQFVRGLPANNVLLSGSRGTGKSSLVKALLAELAPEGLRLVEVDKAELVHLPDIVEPLYERPERFILFSDDLSFEADDPSYKALKAILDGSIAAAPRNVLIYATSNRRHLIPEYMKENLGAEYVDGEIHQAEAVEEKISLSERFGLWLSFYPFRQDDYLDIVRHWISVLGRESGMGAEPLGEARWEEIRPAALEWALQRGSRSGRSAYQFARDWLGRQGLGA